MSENEEFERFIGELQAIQPSSRRRVRQVQEWLMVVMA